MSHPLDETFNMNSSEEVEDFLGMHVEIPSDPNMATIVRLALKQYKDLVESAMLMEASDRHATLELARTYLDLAKDTMHKESDLSIKSRRVDVQEAGKRKALPAGEGPGEEEDKPVGKTALWERIEQKKKESGQ